MNAFKSLLLLQSSYIELKYQRWQLTFAMHWHTECISKTPLDNLTLVKNQHWKSLEKVRNSNFQALLLEDPLILVTPKNQQIRVTAIFGKPSNFEPRKISFTKSWIQLILTTIEKLFGDFSFTVQKPFWRRHSILHNGIFHECIFVPLLLLTLNRKSFAFFPSFVAKKLFLA